MEKIQLNSACLKFNKLYHGEKTFSLKNNYFDLVILMMALLDIGNKDEAAKLINSYCMEIPDGKKFLIITALTYDHVKFFNLINELYTVDIDNDFIYLSMKNKSIKIVDYVRLHNYDFNINISLNNYMGIQNCIIEFDDKEYLPIFTSIIRLFNERSKTLYFDKVSLIYTCFIKDAVLHRKWYFLAIILSYYAEEANREIGSDRIVREVFTECLFNDLFIIIEEQEQRLYLIEIKKLSVLKEYLIMN